MIPITDPDEIRDLDNRGLPGGGSSAATTAPKEEGSVWDTTKERWQTAIDATLYAHASERNSAYATRRLKNQVERMKAEEAKLTTMQNIGSGLLAAAPAIGVGLVNPYAGGAVAMGLATGEALAEQAREGVDKVNFGKAVTAGGVTGLIDTATGKAGTVLRGGRYVSKPVKKIMTEMAEDAVSGAGGQAAMNWAAEKDLTEGMGEAALLGAGAGQVLRRVPTSKADVQNMKDTLGGIGGGGKGPDLPPDFSANLQATKAAYDDSLSRVKSAKGEDAAEAIDTHIKSSMDADSSQYFAEAAAMMGDRDIPLTMAVESAHLPSNYRGGDDVVAGQAYFGKSEKDINREVGVAGRAQKANLFGQSGVDQKLTAATHYKDFQAKGKKLLNDIEGTTRDNLAIATEYKKFAEGSNAPAEALADARKLETGLRRLQEMTKYAGGADKKNVSADLELYAKETMALAKKLGIEDRFVNYKGEAGLWDPVQTQRMLDTTERMLRAEMHNFHNANYDVSKEGGLDVTDVLLMGTTGGVGNIGRELYKHKTQRDLKKAKKRGRSLSERLKENLSKTPTKDNQQPSGPTPKQGQAKAAPEAEPFQKAPEEPQQQAEPQPQAEAGAKAGPKFTSGKEGAFRPEPPKGKATPEPEKSTGAPFDIPKDYAKRADENLYNNLVTKHVDAENRKAFMDSVGGLEGMRDRIKKSQNPNESESDYFAREYSKHKTRESEKARTKKEEETKAKNRKDKHKKLDEDLEKYDEDIREKAKKEAGIKSDEDDFDPAAVKKRAKELQKERDEQKKADDQKADESASQAAKETEFETQRTKIYDVVTKIKGNQTFKRKLRADLKRTLDAEDMTSLTPAKIRQYTNKMYDEMKKEIDRLTKGAKDLDDAEYQAAQKSITQLNEALGYPESVRKQMMDDLDRARKEAQAMKERRKKKEKESDPEAEKAAEKQSDQEDDMLDEVHKAGGTKEDFDELKEKAFKDGPIDDAQLREKIRKIIEEDFVNPKAEEVKKKAKKELEDLSDDELAKKIEEATDEASSTEVQTFDKKGYNDALSEMGKLRGLREVKIFQKVQEIISRGVAMKEKYPNNKAWWIAADDILALQKLYNDKYGGKDLGNLGVEIRLTVADDRDYAPKLSKKKIEEEIRSGVQSKGKLGGLEKGETRMSAKLKRIKKENKK